MKELLNGMTQRKEHGGNMTIFDKFETITTFLDDLTPKIVILALCIVIMVLIIDAKRKLGNRKKQIKTDSKAKAHGVVFGKKGMKVVYSPSDQEGHIVCMGGSGVGKTSSLLIPTLRSWDSTCLVVDIAGDICRNVDMPNKIIYEPANPNSIPYNIFGTIDNLENEDDQNETLEELAFLMMPDDERMSDASKFFNTEGRKILTAALISFYHAYHMDFIPICEKVINSSWKELFNAIDATGYSKGTQYLNSFIGTSEQNTAGAKQATDSVLKLFGTNERVKKTIRRPNKNEVAFTPAILEKKSVFIVIDDSRLKLYAPLLHIITAQSLEFFSNRSNESKTTILFCLDEFASLGKLEIIDALRKLRKKHIRLLILTQSLPDIDLVYGREERMAMMNNFRFTVLMNATDADTQEYYAKIIGYKDTTRHSTSSNSRQTTHTESESKEFIVEPAELARLGDNLILLHPDGHMILKKNFYYK